MCKDWRQITEGGQKSAYFTVEAALLLPLALLFITMMIFLAFYSYDRCILEQSAYEAALHGTSNHLDNAEDAYQESMNAAARLVEDRLFALRDLKYHVVATADTVTVTYYCEVNMPLITWLSTYIGNLDFSLEVHGEAKRSRQTRTIRGCRIINRLIPE